MSPHINSFFSGTDMERSKILSYQHKAPVASDVQSNGLKVLYSHTQSPLSKTSTRHIPQAPDRILDAPDIVNDYYLNLLDWSSNNHLAVALGPHIYLWNAANGIVRLRHIICWKHYIHASSYSSFSNRRNSTTYGAGGSYRLCLFRQMD